MLPQDSIVSELSLSSPTLAGRAYRILRSTEVDVYDNAVQPEELAAPFLERLEAQSGDKFRGKARKAAKLAIATAPVEDFDDLEDLLDSLPADADMIAHTPPITVGVNSGRVAEEKRNVRVRAFLYAAS